MGSIPVGVIKLAQQFVTTDPVSQRDLDALQREISSVVKPLQNMIAPWADKSTRLIGTAGTFTTIASIDLGLDDYSRQRIHLHAISLEKLKDMLNMLVALPVQERQKVRGLEPERADLIIPGLLFTINVMESFGFRTLTVSDHGLLEGLLIETKEAYEKDISEAEKP
jgi:exopolyphosphatase/guanosine-5'-triphosphate,3'-diphosphate pyrophosphatase